MAVIFVDMDYFFAACEELRHPESRDKPLAVGTSEMNKTQQRGVIESCNYLARARGIRAAMPIAEALKIEPNLVYFKDDDAYYEQMSERVMALLRSYGFATEVASIDEAALDAKTLSAKQALELAAQIKQRINAEVGLPCTLGVSSGKVLAKMVCDAAKPNGLMMVESADIRAFLADKPISKFPGIGEKTEAKLNKAGIRTINDIAKTTPMKLMDLTGSFGKELYLLANGTDNSKVVESYELLSVGRERTLKNNTTDMGEIAPELSRIASMVAQEVLHKGFWFKTVTLKVRYADFTDKLKSTTLSHYTDSEQQMYDAARRMAIKLVRDKQVRKVGIRVSALIEGKRQMRL